MKVRPAFWVVAVVSGLVACGSDDSGGSSAPSSCAADPQSCGAGKTCWVVNTQGKYDCIAATTDKPAGAACQNLVGTAQCNEGLMCFPGQSGSAAGSCQPFCAKDKTCANGGQCAGVQLINAPGAATVYACAPSGTGGTGGAAGMGGAAGSGGSTGGASGSGGSGGSTGGSGGSSGGADAGADASDAAAD